MEKKEEIKPKKVSIILGWIFGVIFGLIGLVALISGDIVPTIILVMLSIIVIPPLSYFIQEKMNLKLSMGVKIVIVVVLFTVLILIVLINAMGTTSTTTKNNPTITQNEHSIKSISQNEQGYWENNITIKITGTLGYKNNFYLEDSEGYYVLIEDESCIGIHRIPKEGTTYTFEGRLLNNGYHYYLFCNV